MEEFLQYWIPLVGVLLASFGCVVMLGSGKYRWFFMTAGGLVLATASLIAHDQIYVAP